MGEKSHVGMEQRLCVVCSHAYDTGSILLDKRLRATLDRNVVVGHGLCPEHQQKHDDGYVALVGCDPSKSTVGPDNRASPDEVWRTGSVAHLRRTAFEELFRQPHPVSKDGEPLPVIFVEEAVITRLEEISRQAQEESEDGEDQG